MGIYQISASKKTCTRNQQGLQWSSMMISTIDPVFLCQAWTWIFVRKLMPLWHVVALQQRDLLSEAMSFMVVPASTTTAEAPRSARWLKLLALPLGLWHTAFRPVQSYPVSSSPYFRMQIDFTSVDMIQCNQNGITIVTYRDLHIQPIQPIQ